MNTPKTDAACGWPWGHHGRIECSDLKWSPDGPFVHSEVARHLERENVALRKQLEQWEQSTQWFAEWADKKQELERENAALRAAIAESEEFARKNGETLAAKVKELLAENEALRKEKDRLDWLITSAPFCVLSTLSSDPVAARLKIDREMEFPTT